MRDEEYRYAYAEDFLNTFVATQIRVLREQRGMTQGQLAEKIGTKQAGVSRYENVNHSSWKTDTLRTIARALGVRLKITFEPFGSLLDEAGSFSAESLRRPEFKNDPAFSSIKESPAQEIAQTMTWLEQPTSLPGFFMGSIANASLSGRDALREQEILLKALGGANLYDPNLGAGMEEPNIEVQKSLTPGIKIYKTPAIEITPLRAKAA
jgi:transcriptional regulator with XRE-family HTH domain